MWVGVRVGVRECLRAGRDAGGTRAADESDSCAFTVERGGGPSRFTCAFR